ncbi:hypothetical protein [Deinococcus aquaedulcis]|uniref:hypothetical protein n=1 Tax=Deinococcus aquaedulcis TaxID=2840455 RepID=UPI001C836A6D|nr:hypothetical protein [Deinococcus aquaedulcis]
MRTVPFFLLLSLGMAGASCALETQLDLPSYSALSPLNGALTITVRCDLPGEATTLFLDAPGAAVNGNDLHLFLYGAAERTTLVLRGAAPLRAGLPLSGTQTLRFPLSAPANQWVSTGWYAAPLTLDLRTPLP